MNKCCIGSVYNHSLGQLPRQRGMAATAGQRKQKTTGTYAFLMGSCPYTSSDNGRGGPWLRAREPGHEAASRRSSRPSACGPHWARTRLPVRPSVSRSHSPCCCQGALDSNVLVWRLMRLSAGGALGRAWAVAPSVGKLAGGLTLGDAIWRRESASGRLRNGVEWTEAYLRGDEGREGALLDEAHLDGCGPISTNWTRDGRR